MKRAIFTICIVLVSFGGFAQQSASYTVNDFDKLKVWGEFKVFLTKGDTLTARVQTQGIPSSDIVIETNNKTLEVKLKGKLYDKVSATVFITYKELREISVSAAAIVSLQDTLKADKLTLTVNTSSEFDGGLVAETADISVGQGATVRLRGKVNSYEANVNTGGILSAIDLISPKTYVKVSSGANAKVYASKLLEANVRTGGNLTYTGSPEQKNIKTFIGASIIEQ